MKTAANEGQTRDSFSCYSELPGSKCHHKLPVGLISKKTRLPSRKGRSKCSGTCSWSVPRELGCPSQPVIHLTVGERSPGGSPRGRGDADLWGEVWPPPSKPSTLPVSPLLAAAPSKEHGWGTRTLGQNREDQGPWKGGKDVAE